MLISQVAVAAGSKVQRRRKPRRSSKMVSHSCGELNLENLLRALAEVLGKGTFGTAYKAVLDSVTLVAVKRLKDVTMQDRELKEKIEVVGAMDHELLVPSRAYYYSGDEKLLVYEFMPMGILSALLHGESYLSLSLLRNRRFIVNSSLPSLKFLLWFFHKFYCINICFLNPIIEVVV